MSKTRGDGGLIPGGLVFSEQFESFAGKELVNAVREITPVDPDPVMNVGGPSIVALIHAAQLLHDTGTRVQYHGARGDDGPGGFLQEQLEKTPVNVENLKILPGATPSTIVLSDPEFSGGHGERAFINDIGVAWQVGPDDLDSSFFDADVVVFGGTALVPGLHDHLTGLLKKAKANGCLTVVNTVYDFRSEIRDPGGTWPLGREEEAYPWIDLLITDLEEALHMSGEKEAPLACRHLSEKGVSALLVTRGTDPTLACSDGRVLGPLSLQSFPISKKLVCDLQDTRGGDTTGCGDNFAGGVLASLAWQMMKGAGQPELLECLAWGTVSGGHCCFHVGGTFVETRPGEKLGRIRPYFEAYMKQIDA